MHNILQKCIAELTRETPKIDYVLGMLETLVDMSAKPEPVFHTTAPMAPTYTIGTQPLQTVSSADDSSLLDAQAKALLNNLPPVQYE